MEKVSVKNFSTILVSLLVFSLMMSGFYNTFYVDFHISKSIFDDSKYSVAFVDYLPSGQIQNVNAKSRKRLAYSKRRPTTYKNAVEIGNPRESKTNVNYHAHIKGELNLELVEFFNAKHFKNVLKGGEIEGNLVASDGIIESLEIFLPNNDEISASFTEMNGNVFTYDHGGETFSGLIYQSGNSNYTVSLVNGPYQGSKMKFLSKDHGERTLSYAEIIEEEKKIVAAPEVSPKENYEVDSSQKNYQNNDLDRNDYYQEEEKVTRQEPTFDYYEG